MNDTDRHLPAIQHVTSISHTRARNALIALHKALDLWAGDSDRLASERDLYALADGLDRIRDFRRAVSDLEQHIVGHVAGLMEQDVVNLDDDVTLERRRGNSRKQWQSTELLRHLVGDQLVDASTGEPVFDKLAACLPLNKSLAWKVTGLRANGVDPDEWCDVEPGRVSVQVRVKADDVLEVESSE